MVENVFVVGLDDHNAAILNRLPDAGHYHFHRLLSSDELLFRDTIPLPELLAEAQQQIAAFDGPVHAIIGFWDFPVSTMVPMLCQRLGLRWASLESVVKCEHKYWSRLEQRRVIDEYPRFGLVDLDDDEPTLPDGLHYPAWVKPVKSVSSALAYRVDDPRQLRQAAAAIREGIPRMGEPFEFVLSQLQLPPEVSAVGGRACMAEEAATGAQVTVEGYSFQGDVHVYGTVDSITWADSSSFLRYQYPSSLPAAVTQRMAELSERVIRQIGLDGITFNIEYFWDPDHDRISLLEVNPRHSQSHAELFEHVDGIANHDHMLQLALGREPRPRHREGPYDIAAKWFVRRGADGVARRVPTAEEVDQVERTIPGCTVDVTVSAGDRLSELYDQDSYSYALATVYLGADDEDELIRKYERALRGLRFEFEEPTG
jgi:biotin carboxylase